MFFRPENKCSFCVKVFCCQKCRIRHEINNHFQLFFESIYCNFCNGSVTALVLKKESPEAFVDHLVRYHLPLHCKSCGKVFKEKVDFKSVHACVPKPIQAIEKDAKNPIMALEDVEEQTEPTVGEDIDEKNVGDSCEKNKGSDDLSVALEKSKRRSKTFDGSLIENGSLIPNMSSINNSDHTNKTRSPVKNVVRTTSTPMPRKLSQIKRRSIESMSASSIKTSSFTSSTETDASPPIVHVLPTPNQLAPHKPLNRNMHAHGTLYQQMVIRAISSQNRRFVNDTPPLDLRTSPVLRRTRSFESGSIRVVRTTSDTSQAFGKDMAVDKSQLDDLHTPNMHNSQVQQEPLQSALSRSKSTSSFYVTCKSFHTKDINPVSSIEETPKSTGILRRPASFAARNMEQCKEDCFTPAISEQESSKNIDEVSDINASKPSEDGNVVLNQSFTETGVFKENTLIIPAIKRRQSTLWSLVSSVFGLASTGENTDNIRAASYYHTDSSNAPSLIKRCASFAGILTKREPIDIGPNIFPQKRRRTTTMFEMDNCKSEVDVPVVVVAPALIQVKRIHGRPPINRMRQS